MSVIAKLQRVEQLLRIKYPMSWAPPPMSLSSGASPGRRADHAAMMAKIEEERNALLAMTEGEFDSAYAAAVEAERNRAIIKAQLEEKARFFSRRDATADFDYWAKAEYWSMDESVALLLGKAPEVVTWQAVQPFRQVSEFAKKFEQLRNLAMRAHAMNLGQAAQAPGRVVAWADENGIDVPAALRVVLEAKSRRQGAIKVANPYLQGAASASQANPYLPAAASVQQACTWLQSKTGQHWPLARLLEHGLVPWFWIDHSANAPAELFNGRLEGFLAPMLFAGDTQRLAVDSSDVLVTMSRTPDGVIFKTDPPMRMALSELRFKREDLRRVADELSAEQPAPPQPAADQDDVCMTWGLVMETLRGTPGLRASLLLEYLRSVEASSRDGLPSSIAVGGRSFVVDAQMLERIELLPDVDAALVDLTNPRLSTEKSRLAPLGSVTPGSEVPSPIEATRAHRVRRRVDPLGAVIDKARATAIDGHDWQSVWASLVCMASLDSRPAPLLGYGEGEGVKYQTDDENEPVKWLTKDALRKRIERTNRP